MNNYDYYTITNFFLIYFMLMTILTILTISASIMVIVSVQ